MSRLAVVFAGGGCRAFWALGAFEGVRHLLPRVDEWAGVSAGSAMALGAALQRSDRVVEEFCQRTGRNPSNFAWGRFFRGQRPFPHEDIYRDTVNASLGDDAVERLREIAPVRILIAEVEGAYPLFRVYSALRRYQRRRKQGGLHGPSDVSAGIVEVIVTAQQLTSAQEITNAVLASSASPPITRVQRGLHGPAYDGSLVDNVPIRALRLFGEDQDGDNRVLVFLNRPMPALPNTRSVLYLAPSRPVPIQKWDYTSPDKVRATVAQGREEAAGYVAQLKTWLSG